MNLEGRVRIDLPTTTGSPVRVDFSQPGNINNILRGRDPDTALRLLPAIYSVCATAQGHAAVLALERATGNAVSPMTKAARKALTGMETLREHLLRIALDWPRFLAKPPRGTHVRPVMGLVLRLTRALFESDTGLAIGWEAKPDRKAATAIVDEAERLLVKEIFAEPLERWLARAEDSSVMDWSNKTSTIAGKLIARVTQAGWSAVGETPAIGVPSPATGLVRDWLVRSRSDREALPRCPEPTVPETTLFSRRFADPVLSSFTGSGLGPRLVARLVELARLPGELRALIAEDDERPAIQPDADGFGWSAVEAARGLLIHAVELQDGVIADYRVLPPTRWNFDSEGVAKRCLTEIDGSDCETRLHQANLIVNAIDPCVAHEVRVH